LNESTFYIEGKNPVLEALHSDRIIDKIYITAGNKDSVIKSIISLAKEKGIIIQEVSKEKLDKMAKTQNHQGVIALSPPYRYYELEEVMELIREKKEKPLFLILDEINDPVNLGSLMRTADASGVHAIIIPKRRSVGLTPAVARVSMGAIEYVPVIRVNNIARTIEELKDKGIWIFGADAAAESLYYQADFNTPMALVLGSEGKGLRPVVKEKCDFLIKIPMLGRISSLNVGVAGAVILFEVLRQRKKD